MRFLLGDSKKRIGRLLLVGLFLTWTVSCASTSPPVVEIDTGGSDLISEPAIITDILTIEDENRSTVIVKGNKPLAYSSIKQTEPQRLILDFPDTALYLYNVETASIQDSTVVEAIKTSELDKDGNVSRIEILLKQDALYEINDEGGGLQIQIEKPRVAQKIETESLGDAPSLSKNEYPIEKPVDKIEVIDSEEISDHIDKKAVNVADQDNATEPQKKIDVALTDANPEELDALPPKLELVDVDVKRDNIKVAVNISGKVGEYKAFVLGSDGKGKPRIVVDLDQVKSEFQGEQKIAVKSKLLKQVRHYGYPDKVRLVLDTYQEYLDDYDISVNEQGLIIQVGKLSQILSEGESTPRNDANSATISDTKTAIVEKPEIVQSQEIVAQTDSEPIQNNLDVVDVENNDKIQDGSAISEIASTTMLNSEDAVLSEIDPIPGESNTNQAAAEKSKVGEKPAWLNRIEFTSVDAGRSTLLIGTTHPIKYKINKQSGQKIALQLINTRIPEYRKRPLITTRFNSAVNRILPVQTSSLMDNDAVISIELREMVPYVTEQSDTTVLVHFEASKVPPKPLEDANLPEWKQVFNDVIEKQKAEKELEKASVAVSDNPIDRVLGKATIEYSGEKIALDFYQTDIKNVFRILREVSGKNFAIDKDVTGKVTLTLDKPVPWDQILDLVLKMNQLDRVYEGDIIRISTNATVRKEEAEREAALRAARAAQEQARALEPLYTEYLSVNYSDATSEILPHLKNLMTENRGMVSVDKRNNQIIMTDTAEKIRQAKDIVQEIDKVTPQVIIEARIVEVNSEFSKSLGIEWGTGIGIQDPSLLQNVDGVPSIYNDELTNRVAIGPQRGFDIGGGTYGYNMAMNFPAQGDSGQIGFNFARILGTPLVLNAKITALETEGTGKIISAPKIITLDNKAANIKQGVEVPYATVSADGTKVEFKNVDLSLQVTPHVTPDDRISMKIAVTKNDVIADTNPPALSTNEANTELLVNDGDTIVIGGIMRSTQTSGEEGFPIVKDVPVLGWLFKTKSEQTTSTELLIFITPKIVQLEQRNDVGEI